MKLRAVILTLISAVQVFSMSGDEILLKMDQNRNFSSMQYRATMTIIVGNETRTKEMTVKAISGEERKAMVEFTNPEDRGTKYLMIGDNLWIYFPSEKDVVRISGHMLKEGMMGSDLSYEDALRSDELRKKYSVSVIGEESIEGRKCFIIQLDAKVRNVPYYKRKMWVEKEKFVAVKEKMYARSGRLLKKANLLEVKVVGERTVPVKMEMVNKLRKDSRTVFEMHEVVFDKEMDESRFSIRYLRR
ncbi:outer membrane lipoprotein-sorting protein [Chitinispirillales bacterium ANBcel5]|uniref:outer membrane lipoprotein-sorting protein n=1 Tax=Cellulosispirillum alkaliphilum TaxID=3039283 RepID=UPI002A52960F|nr:outer membrane lipoprotein-sorting protein [Chitinispirillales bacterium ANBcel5]